MHEAILTRQESPAELFRPKLPCAESACSHATGLPTFLWGETLRGGQPIFHIFSKIFPIQRAAGIEFRKVTNNGSPLFSADDIRLQRDKGEVSVTYSPAYVDKRKTGGDREKLGGSLPP